MNKHSEKLFFIFLALILGLLLYTRLTYLHIPFERDEGEYAYAGSLLLHGRLPYQEAYNMKFPGAYFMYALLMKAGVETTEAVRAGLCFIILLTAFLIGGITRLLTKNNAAAAVATVLFFALSNNMWCQGLMANSEHFVNLFTVSGILFLLLFLQRGNRPGLLFISGFLIGASVIMKQYAYPFCAFGLIVLLAGMNKSSLPDKIKAILVFATGGILPALLMAVWVLRNGLWQKFRFLTIDYAYAYIGIYPSKIGGIVSFILIICLLVSIFVVRQRNARFICGWFIVSIIALATGLYFRPHYYILAFPVLAVTAGYVYDEAGRKLSVSASRAAVVLVFILFYIIHGKEQFTSNPNEIYRANYPNEIFADMPEVAKRISTFIPATDKLSIFGNEPEILFYSRHISASGYIYNYPLFEVQRYAQQMTDEYIREVENNPSKLFIYSTISLGAENLPVFNHFHDWWKVYSQQFSLKAVYCVNPQNIAVYKNEDELKADSTWKNIQHIEFWMKKD